MSRHALVCVLQGERHEINLHTLNCYNQSHIHISRTEAIIREENNEVEWIKEPVNRKDKGIVRLLNQNFSIRGMSCKVGATLVRALTEREVWAGVMLSDILRRKLEKTPEETSLEFFPLDRNAPLAAVTA